MFERILITGGTGFIGRYVLERMGRTTVRPVVTSRDPSHISSNNVDFVHLDLKDTSRTRKFIRSYRPQAVIHLAGVSGTENPKGKQAHDVSVVAARGVLEALDGVGCERVVMIGSASEYGSQSTPFHEDMSPMPVSAYGFAKARSTGIGMEMYRTKGLPVTVLRVFSAYGYGQPNKMFLSQAITHALQATRFEMSDGTQRRDFIHAEDVARAIIRAINSDDSVDRIINIGSSKSYALADVARTIWNECDAKPDLLAIGARDKVGDDCLDTEADITLAKQLLGWEPRIPFLDPIDGDGGLKRTIRQMISDLSGQAGSS